MKQCDIEETIARLRTNKDISQVQFNRFLLECRRIVTKLYVQAKLPSIIYKEDLKEDVINDVMIDALLKSMKTYNNKKAQFFTYYYYKVRSLMGVKRGYYYRRHYLINAIPYEDRTDNIGEDDYD